MALIGNEYRYAEKLMTGAVKEKNLFKALVILTKYYYFELSMNEKEIEKNLRLYIKAMGGNVDDDNTLAGKTLTLFNYHVAGVVKQNLLCALRINRVEGKDLNLLVALRTV